MTGIYIRFGTKNILLEDLTPEQRHEWIEERCDLEKNENLQFFERLVDILCETINEQYNSLGGNYEKKED